MNLIDIFTVWIRAVILFLAVIAVFQLIGNDGNKIMHFK